MVDAVSFNLKKAQSTGALDQCATCLLRRLLRTLRRAGPASAGRPDGAEVFATLGSASSSGPSGSSSQRGRGSSSRPNDDVSKIKVEAAGVSASDQRPINALEEAQLAVALAASCREAGGAPDGVFEC